MALLRSLVALAAGSRTELIVAHFNHRWRGLDSDDDQRFVERLSQRHGLGCELAAASDASKTSAVGESNAREARYQFLCEVGSLVGARYVVTAHTADDQAETILHRIIRGTGLAGLAGIPRTRQLTNTLTLMRPLLAVRRSEVLHYLQELGQTFREDATNQDRKYTRNRIRHELIPQVEQDYNDHVTEALLRLGTLAGEAQGVLQPLAVELYERGLRERDSCGVTLQLQALQAAPHYLFREMLIVIWKDFDWPLQDMSYDKWTELAAWAVDDQPTIEQRLTLPGCVCAKREGSTLRLWRES